MLLFLCLWPPFPRVADPSIRYFHANRQSRKLRMEGGHQNDLFVYLSLIWEKNILDLCCKWKLLSHVLLFTTPWTCQAPLSMEFSRQEYWSKLPLPSQGIFLTQRLNLGLLHRRQILYWLNQSIFCFPPNSFLMLTEKKPHILKKLRILFYLADKTEELSLGLSPSETSERLLQRGKGGARINRGFCNKDQVVRTSKDYC